MAQSTLPKLKTSTDLCPVDLGDGVSSRAEFLGLGMQVCSHKKKSQRKIRFQRLEKYLFFGDCLQLSVYTVKENNTIFRFWFYRERGSKTSNYKGWRKEGRGPELLFRGVVRPLLGKQTCSAQKDGDTEFLAQVPPNTIGTGPAVEGEQQMVPETS